MTPIRETFSKGGSLRRMLQESPIEQLMSPEDHNIFEEVIDLTKDYIKRDFGTMRSVQSHADRLDHYYRRIWRPEHGHHFPRLIWDLPRPSPVDGSGTSHS